MPYFVVFLSSLLISAFSGWFFWKSQYSELSDASQETPNIVAGLLFDSDPTTLSRGYLQKKYGENYQLDQLVLLFTEQEQKADILFAGTKKEIWFLFDEDILQKIIIPPESLHWKIAIAGDNILKLNMSLLDMERANGKQFFVRPLDPEMQSVVFRGANWNDGNISSDFQVIFVSDLDSADYQKISCSLNSAGDVSSQDACFNGLDLKTGYLLLDWRVQSP